MFTNDHKQATNYSWQVPWYSKITNLLERNNIKQNVKPAHVFLASTQRYSTFYLVQLF